MVGYSERNLTSLAKRLKWGYDFIAFNDTLAVISRNSNLFDQSNFQTAGTTRTEYIWDYSKPKVKF